MRRTARPIITTRADSAILATLEGREAARRVVAPSGAANQGSRDRAATSRRSRIRVRRNPRAGNSAIRVIRRSNRRNRIVRAHQVIIRRPRAARLRVTTLRAIARHRAALVVDRVAEAAAGRPAAALAVATVAVVVTADTVNNKFPHEESISPFLPIWPGPVQRGPGRFLCAERKNVTL